MRNGKKPRLSRASTIVSCVALFAALGGSAYAAKDLITGKEIAKNTITGKNVKKGSLKKNDLSKKTVSSLKGKQGPQGVQGPQGPKGADGVIDPLAATDAQENLAANSTESVITMNVPAGEYIVTANTNMFSTGVDTWSCDIEANNANVPEAEARWEPAAANITNPASAQGIAPAGTTQLELVCGTAGDVAAVSNSSLIAVPVG
jgi:hypothetical protein